jgi:hypothetical protein
MNTCSLLQKIEKTFKVMLNIESTKECKNILLLTNVVL